MIRKLLLGAVVLVAGVGLLSTTASAGFQLKKVDKAQFQLSALECHPNFDKTSGESFYKCQQPVTTPCKVGLTPSSLKTIWAGNHWVVEYACQAPPK
ncbi:MAG: hypothetical protein CL910_02080 [Deltaproteobacteria bacterium]|jgi:hypothetical protein|nr:hypothetical protein [Deltaproteobacteria bacterium]